MELRHLRYFIAVAEEENVSRAALKLHVSQPAVSRQVRDLEEELGVPLLERRAKSVELTESGRVFLEEARAVIARADEAVRKIRESRKAEIHVGYAPSLTVQILPHALRRFQKILPTTRVILHDLSTEEMLAQLRSGRLHVALVVQPTAAMLRGLIFEKLVSHAICLAVNPGHALARLPRVTIARAAREPLIGYSEADYPEYRDHLAAMFASVKGRFRLVEEHESATSLIAAVEAGRGAALVPESLAGIAGSRLKFVPVKPAPPAVVVGAAWRERKPGPVMEQFLTAVRCR